MNTEASTSTVGLRWSGAVLCTAVSMLPLHDAYISATYPPRERPGSGHTNIQPIRQGSAPFPMSVGIEINQGGFATSSPVGGVADEIASDDSYSPVDGFHDELLADISALHSLPVGWDGEDSLVPSSDLIADALVVAQAWPQALGAPAVDVGYDGKVSLELFDDAGFLVAGIDVIGDNHQAVFSVVSGSEVLDSGRFDTENQTEVIQTFARIQKAIA